MKMKSLGKIFLFFSAVFIILTIGSCDLLGPGILAIVNNHASLAITEVYIRSSGASDWGVDLLASDDIPAGYYCQFSVNSGDYEIRVRDSNLNYYAALGIYIGSGEIIWLYFDGAVLAP